MLKTYLQKALIIFLFSVSYSALAAPHLTTYITEWAGYGGYSAGEYPAYPVDGSYKSIYHDLTPISNPDMVKKVGQTDLLDYAFLQVWNPNSPQAPGITIPTNWAGHLHFDDLWANLPNANASDYAYWQSFCSNFLTDGSSPECSAIQRDGSGKLQKFDYTKIDVGQMDNFGAFLKLSASTKKVVSIGGANTVTNKSVSTASYQAIFANQAVFLNSLSIWVTKLGINGVDYDFEPPIDNNGGQLPPGPDTLTDYKNLFNLIKATRDKLGADAYISVTITVNEAYLDYINRSVDGGWFKQIAPYVSAINLMTYDLHGPWSLSADPGAISHVMLATPDKSILPNPEKYAVNYAMSDVVAKVMQYGVDPSKLQVGLASYGRGFSGVVAGASQTYPGFGLPWSGASNFDTQYTNGQEGMLPYKFVKLLQEALGYKSYEIKDNNGQTIAAYIYNPTAQQLVGYESPNEVKSVCQFIKNTKLQGAILWSMDTDADDSSAEGPSLMQEYNSDCRLGR
jgi:chitinase